jgi:hypothetical protein
LLDDTGGHRRTQEDTGGRVPRVRIYRGSFIGGHL